MILSVDTLQQWMKQDETFMLLDARHDLKDEEKGKRLYNEAHIPGAIFIDMVEDMADRALQEGGRYPLPSDGAIIEMAERKGIDEATPVVIYDEGSGGMAAGRAWWMLTYIGHSSVYVLDGGFKEWTSRGYQTTNERHKPTRATFSATIRDEMKVAHDDVAKRSKATHLLDARAYDRFLGEQEELDAKSGHIPGAASLFWKQVLNEDGTWKNKEQLEQEFKPLGDKNKEVIVYCGSGISACPLYLGLEQAGFTNVKLYPGSWSDWITHDYPIEKGE
ncbi:MULTISPECIES: sulfurtransferase [Shouchella]|uniref:Sulfurtransferase n=2 Tax=Shouchella TaxID=2893057 RepID=A0ABY7W877_9BACI|nr:MULTISPECIES: sulfurtransferase [Shouchella]MED4126670.1 sulfurtransferase [Shouchella miscanthi]WDF04629.1 sulfurtransferase [Shouchella hunanensis]